jgi:hypothetical protein
MVLIHAPSNCPSGSGPHSRAGPVSGPLRANPRHEQPHPIAGAQLLNVADSYRGNRQWRHAVDRPAGAAQRLEAGQQRMSRPQRSYDGRQAVSALRLAHAEDVANGRASARSPRSRARSPSRPTKALISAGRLPAVSARIWRRGLGRRVDSVDTGARTISGALWAWCFARTRTLESRVAQGAATQESLRMFCQSGRVRGFVLGRSRAEDSARRARSLPLTRRNPAWQPEIDTFSRRTW